MKAQANVLARQQRRAFLKLKQDTTMAQAYIKRYLAMSWLVRVKDQNDNLNEALRHINDTIGKYNQDASAFKQEFRRGDGAVNAPQQLDHMTDFEGMQKKAFNVYKAEGPSMVPGLLQVNSDYERLKKENESLRAQLGGLHGGAKAQKNASIDASVDRMVNEEELKAELGEKYDELGDMVDHLKANMKRLADMAKKARPLSLKMQHVYQYSKWDAIHEPYNVVENVLKDDEKVYKALTPTFDFTVNNGTSCFISHVVLSPGDCGPQQMEVYLSNNIDQWQLAKAYTATKSASETLVIPGENMAKYVRVRCVNNVRGGNLVDVRFIQVKGLMPEEIPPQR